MKAEHSLRVNQWGQAMLNYQSKLLQRTDGGGVIMNRRRHNQTWEELPPCVQRYLQRVAPDPVLTLKSLSYQQRGEVSLWVGRWNNFTSSALISEGGLITSGIVDLNNLFDYRYSDVYVEGRGHRVGYQYGPVGVLYAQNIEFEYRCLPYRLICQGYLSEGKDRDDKEINMIEGKKWLQESVLTPSLLRPEAGVVTWKKHFDMDGKEVSNSAEITLTKKAHEQVFATAMFDEEGFMTHLKYRETITIPSSGKSPWYQMTYWQCRFSEYKKQAHGMWVPTRVERGMVPFLSFGGRNADDDGFEIDYRADRFALEYQFHD